MKPIQMVDLKSQYQKIRPEIDQRIAEVLDSSAFINGPAVKSFQENLEKYLLVKHVIPCSNGTDALQVTLMTLNLQPGDEIITTPFTFIATAEVVVLLKLKTVFVDVEPDTFNLNTDLIEQAITPKTKAIVPVHLFGQCCDMEKIMEIAEKHNLFVIEDTCQAIGAEYTFKNGKTQKAGTIGHIGCTSFFPSKNLGCYGDGGAIFTNDDLLAEKMRGIVNHGMFVRYYHEMIGVNSRLDSIQAAVLDVKLKYLDEYNATRYQTAEYYNRAFANQPNITTPVIGMRTTHVFHQYTLKIKDMNRDELIKKMNKAGIPVMIYYPVALHLQKAFADFGGQKGDFPVTEALCDCVISLPMHSEMEEEQAEYIVKQLLENLM